jgi:hypothetical protein
MTLPEIIENLEKTKKQIAILEKELTRLTVPEMIKLTEEQLEIEKKELENYEEAYQEHMGPTTLTLQERIDLMVKGNKE